MAKHSTIQFLIVLGVIILSAGESLISGTYEREVKPDNKEFLDVLVELGNPKDKAEKMLQQKVIMIITENPDESYSINTISPERKHNHTVTVWSGKEYEDKSSGGKPVKGTYTIEGNKFVGVKKVVDIEVTTESEASEEGIKVTIHVKEKNATYNWKRTSPVKQ